MLPDPCTYLLVARVVSFESYLPPPPPSRPSRPQLLPAFTLTPVLAAAAHHPRHQQPLRGSRRSGGRGGQVAGGRPVLPRGRPS